MNNYTPELNPDAQTDKSNIHESWREYMKENDGVITDVLGMRMEIKICGGNNKPNNKGRPMLVQQRDLYSPTTLSQEFYWLDRPMLDEGFDVRERNAVNQASVDACRQRPLEFTYFVNKNRRPHNHAPNGAVYFIRIWPGYQPPPNKTMSLSEFQNRRKKRKREEEERERETVQGRDHMASSQSQDTGDFKKTVKKFTDSFQTF